MTAALRPQPVRKNRFTGLRKRLRGLYRNNLKTESIPYDELTDAHALAASRLLKLAGRRRAARLIRDARTAWHAENLASDGDVKAWRDRKQAARAQLRRRLMREVPNFREWSKLRSRHLKEYGRLVRKRFAVLTEQQLPLGWNIGQPPASVRQLRRFSPPFRVTDVGGAGDGGFLEKDESSVQQNGILVNDLVLDHDEDTPIILGVFGLPGRAQYTAYAACGISYAMPLTGRLYVAPELVNLYNYVTLSLKDNFGLSDGKLHVTINLDIVVSAFPQPLIHLPKILFTTTLLSEGDDQFLVMPDLETEYTWERTTNESFEAGATLEILVAAEVRVQSVLDDMRSHVEGVLAWQLRRLGVGVI